MRNFHSSFLISVKTFNFHVINQSKMSLIKGETTSFGLRYVVKGGPKDRAAQKGGFIDKGERPFKKNCG